MRLVRESELHFGPSYYKGDILDRQGKHILDLDGRHFFSCFGYGLDNSEATGPWNPASQLLALPELLSKETNIGAKIARMTILDVARNAPIAAWNFESVVAHKMWSADGCLYLFCDAYGVYVFSMHSRNLTSIVDSRSPHCFLLPDRYVCVIERTGKVSIFDGNSAGHLVSDYIPRNHGFVRHAALDEKQVSVLVLVKNQDSPEAVDHCYAIRLLPRR